MFLYNLRALVWLHPDERHLRVEDLRMGFFQGALLSVPSAALNVETPTVGTVWSLFGLIKLGVVLHLVVPFDQIDSNGILSGEVLLESREEGLSEEETGDPEVWWLAFFNPLIDEVEAFNEIDNVGGERFE